MDDAKAMPRFVTELSGESLYMLVKVGEGSSQAHAARERLRREIMVVDGKEYHDAGLVVEKVEAVNAASARGLGVIPFYVGIVCAQIAGWASLPLVFSSTCAKEFNRVSVTTDVPHASDLETVLEVGMWSWGWMEPPLGTISFFILCMQFSRDQRVTLGLKPWPERYKAWKADQLEEAFPQYDQETVRDFAKAYAFDETGAIIGSRGTYKSAAAASAV